MNNATSFPRPHHPPRLSRISSAVARTVNATKVYGRDDTAVRALDDVSVAFAPGRFTAIMGPSGSGKSTLMHCVAGLDSLTSGQVFIGDTELGTLSDKQLTLLRRERIGFVFQSFNLVPTLTAYENITLPLALAGKSPDSEWVDAVVDTVGCATGCATGRRSCRAGSSSASRWRARWSGGPTSCSPTSRPGTSTRAAGPSCSSSCRWPRATWARRS